jgi:hypothetical protein
MSVVADGGAVATEEAIDPSFAQQLLARRANPFSCTMRVVGGIDGNEEAAATAVAATATAVAVAAAPALTSAKLARRTARPPGPGIYLSLAAIAPGNENNEMLSLLLRAMHAHAPCVACGDRKMIRRRMHAACTDALRSIACFAGASGSEPQTPFATLQTALASASHPTFRAPPATTSSSSSLTWYHRCDNTKDECLDSYRGFGIVPIPWLDESNSMRVRASTAATHAAAAAAATATRRGRGSTPGSTTGVGEGADSSLRARSEMQRGHDRLRVEDARRIGPASAAAAASAITNPPVADFYDELRLPTLEAAADWQRVGLPAASNANSVPDPAAGPASADGLASVAAAAARQKQQQQQGVAVVDSTHSRLRVLLWNANLVRNARLLLADIARAEKEALEEEEGEEEKKEEGKEKNTVGEQKRNKASGGRRSGGGDEPTNEADEDDDEEDEENGASWGIPEQELVFSPRQSTRLVGSSSSGSTSGSSENIGGGDDCSSNSSNSSSNSSSSSSSGGGGVGAARSVARGQPGVLFDAVRHSAALTKVLIEARANGTYACFDCLLGKN